MSYTLIIGEHCPSCVKIIDFIRTKKIDCKIHHIGKGKYTPDLNLMVIPALVNGGRLLAYGEDIISYLSKTGRSST